MKGIHMPADILSCFLQKLQTSTALTTCADAELLELYIDRADQTAFAVLLHRHGPMVYQVCSRILSDEQDAEDALQVTFLLLARKAHSLRDPKALSAWLHGVALRVSRKAKSLAARRHQVMEQLPISDNSTPAEESVEWKDLRPLLDAAIDRLPEKYRLPMILCHLEERSHAEVAKMLGCATATVATRLSRARKRLRRWLQHRGIGLSGLLLAGVADANPLSELLTQRTLLHVFDVTVRPDHFTLLAKGIGTTMIMRKMYVWICGLCLLLPCVIGLNSLFSQNQIKEQEQPKLHRVHKIRSNNFIVHAQNTRIEKKVKQLAERYREQIAKRWLGQELPPWTRPCPIEVKITIQGPAGMTTFRFDDGKVISQESEVHGTIEQILQVTLPHEITHMILADHFGSPLPRWVDEGIAILSESDKERQRQDKFARTLLAKGRLMPLRRLFKMSEYPPDVLALFVQGYSVTSYLVKKKDRKTFLTFVKMGMDKNWDKALKQHYGYRSIEALEEEWLSSIKPLTPPTQATKKPEPIKDQSHLSKNSSSHD